MSSALAIVAVLTVATTPAIPQPAPGRAAATAEAPAAPVGEPMGSGSCAARACHGGARPVDGLAVLRNEYTTWLVRDRHALAYDVLLEPRSADIIRNLGWKGPAHREDRCLACHSTPTGDLAGPAAEAVRREGVSCEACHGPASGWLHEHTSRRWRDRTPQEKASLGMVPPGDLAGRVAACAGCHVGAAPDPARGFPVVRDVDHDLIAAGHPRLTFEFASYHDLMPRHWKEPAEAEGDFPARCWMVGQAVSARVAIDLLKSRAERAVAGRSPWPEFAEYECASCHHPLRGDSAPRDDLEPGRPPGAPAWGSWYYPLTKVLAGDAGPEPASGATVPAALEALRRRLEDPGPDARAVVADADRASRALADWLAAPAHLEATPERVSRLLGEVAPPGGGPVTWGWDHAAQATHALVPLGKSLQRLDPSRVDPSSEQALGRMVEQLNVRASRSGPVRFDLRTSGGGS